MVNIRRMEDMGHMAHIGHMMINIGHMVDICQMVNVGFSGEYWADGEY